MKVSLAKIKPDFEKLQKDRYVSAGFRYKHIVRFKYTKDNEFVRQPLAPLYQPLIVNPTHGNIPRYYPEYEPEYPEEIEKVLAHFVVEAKAPVDSVILFQAQRIICSHNLIGDPSVEGWHRDGVDKVGVMCVDRHNINGGVNLFRRTDGSRPRQFKMILDPGHLIVFDDRQCMHRVTSIMPADQDEVGWRDVFLMSFPECLWPECLGW